jgi:hypothetical protein
LIVKLHGDLTTADGLVLTSSQYKDFKVGSRQYYRTALTGIFSMLPILVVGHSMSDPDLQLLLEVASEAAAPDLPIHMIVADAKKHDIEHYYNQYNINLISYSNSDGDHRNLLHLLRQINRFVVARTASFKPPLDFPDAATSEEAASLYIYSTLGLSSGEPLLQRIVRPQVLAAAASRPDQLINSETILDRIVPPSLRSDTLTQEEVEHAIAGLEKEGLLERLAQQAKVTRKGVEKWEEINQARKFDEDQVYGALRARLRCSVSAQVAQRPG